MKVAIFSAKKYDREFLNAANNSRHELRFFEPHLNEETIGLATGFEAVCVFVNDQVNAAVIAKLRSLGVRLVALRCAGACVHRLLRPLQRGYVEDAEVCHRRASTRLR